MLNNLVIFFTAAAPVFELRGAIPLAIGVYGFSPVSAYVIAVLGNIFPIIPVYFGLRFASGFISARNERVKRFLERLFQWTRERHGSTFNHESHNFRHVLEFFSLLIFVAIPLPLTGVWSATLASIVFGIPFRRAFPAMVLGVFTAGIIVLGATVGITALF